MPVGLAVSEDREAAEADAADAEDLEEAAEAEDLEASTEDANVVSDTMNERTCRWQTG